MSGRDIALVCLASAVLGAGLALLLAPLSLEYTVACDEKECRAVPCTAP